MKRKVKVFFLVLISIICLNYGCVHADPNSSKGYADFTDEQSEVKAIQLEKEQKNDENFQDGMVSNSSNQNSEINVNYNTEIEKTEVVYGDIEEYNNLYENDYMNQEESEIVDESQTSELDESDVMINDVSVNKLIIISIVIIAIISIVFIIYKVKNK